jgi:pimeloyl-ACP methyl ester carboxylesterase
VKLKIDDSALEYEISGSGEPVVFIDGALILDTFLPIMAEPAITNQYSFIRYHRQGYEGSSGLSRVVSIPEQASDCAELLIHLGIERAHVVGHSYGAPARFSSHRPNRTWSIH